MERQAWFGLRLMGYLIAVSFAAAAEPVGTEIEFPATDGGTVTAYWRGNTEADAPTIMLFHMAGSSARGEYADVVPALQANGYSTLAVDLRSGGGRLGVPNQTAIRYQDQSARYCDAYPDMLGAVGWVKTNRPGTRIIAWGSSYSAALVIKLAAERPDALTAVLAFSPASGDPMVNCRPEQFLPQLQIPVLALRPDGEMAVESVQAQAAVFRAAGLPYVEIEGGRHGSLMLQERFTGKAMTEAWRDVLAFMDASVKLAGDRVSSSVAR